MNRPGAAVLAVVTLLSPAPVRAQEPVVVQDLAWFKADVARQTDTTTLRALEQRFTGRGATPDVEALRRLRRGIVRIRLGELGHGWSYGRAADDFRKATSLMPAWIEAWQELGQARQTEARWIASDLRNLGHRLGERQRREAIAAFARAADLDSASIPALAGLVSAATVLRDTTLIIAEVLPRLRRAATTHADTVLQLLVQRARLEREFGDADSAVEVSRRFAARSEHPGLARLELARSLFARGDRGGAAAYFDGAAFDDSTGIAEYRRDLAYIAGDSVLAAFDGANAEQRVAALRRFWHGLDRRDLRTDGEWLAEHYRRLARARRSFVLQTNRPRYHVRDGYDSGSTEFDDRGVVYLRHGDPDRMAGRGTARETWLYFQGDSLYLVEFASGPVTIQDAGDPDDYRLIPAISTLPGAEDPDVRERIQALRPDLMTYFNKAWGWGPYAQARAAAAFRQAARTGIARITTTVSHEFRFRRRLPVSTKVVVVGRAGDAGLVHVLYAIPRAPSDSSGTEAAVLTVRLRLMAEDSSGRVVSVDTTDQLAVGPSLAEQDWIQGRFEVPFPPGTWHYRLALEAAGEFGRTLPPDSLIVPAAAGPLAVSDPALGQAGLGVGWAASPADSAWFQPGRSFRRGLPLDLYFEVYGLSAGELFRTTLTISAGRKARLSIATDERATENLTRVHRTAALGSLAPGRYRLGITVTAGGRTVESRTSEIAVGE